MSNPFISRGQAFIDWFKRDRKENQFYQTSYQSLYDSVNRHGSSTSSQSIISVMWNRIAVDVANVKIRHVRTNELGDYISDMPSTLNKVLTQSANLDQTPQAFMVDAVISLFDEGSIAIVPETTADPFKTDSWDITSLRVAKIKGYKPQEVEVEIYDEEEGKVESWTVPKKYVAIIENPFFYIMNKPNATFKRLVKTLNLLDDANDTAANGKIDLIVHVPYTIRSESRQKIAESRRADIENQLKNSKYGIAYMDPTETVTQLNRPATNNLAEQVAELMKRSLMEIGLTEEILNGTADERVMTNYRNRIVGTIVKAFVQEFSRKFLSPTARSQHQSVSYAFDMFEFTTGKEFAEIAQIMKMSEMASTDELRAKVNWPPSNSSQGDKIQNPNINVATGEEEFQNGTEEGEEGEEGSDPYTEDILSRI